MWGMEYSTHYLPLFNASSRALKDVHKTLRVGGPSTMQTQHVEDLIVDTRRLGIEIDFISTHFYPSDPNCTKPGVGMNGISGDDPDCFAAVLNKARSFAAAADLPFLITEYKDGLQGGAAQRKNATKQPNRPALSSVLFCSVVYIENLQAEILEINELMPQHCRLFWNLNDLRAADRRSRPQPLSAYGRRP